jgi:hypothetical protein
MNHADIDLDWQIATISAFVVKNKRGRYIDKISSTKKRGQFVANLSHFSDFDSRFIVRIAPSSQHPSDIESLLRAKGAPESCLAISEISAIDSQLIPLAYALKQVVGYQMGTILCCIPGQLAYFENEDCRFILEHKTSQS